MDQQDAADIRAARRSDGEAWRRLIGRYQVVIGKQMWRFARERGVWEELVQDVFVEAFFGLAGFKGRAPFLHWLGRIASRVGYRYWKKEARRRRERELIGGQDLASAAEDLSPAEAADCLHSLLARLPPADRLVLTLFYFDGMGTGEIAERTGWSRTLVKVRSFRARQKLKALLEKAGFQGDRYA